MRRLALRALETVLNWLALGLYHLSCRAGDAADRVGAKT